jgi:hypothetical protein
MANGALKLIIKYLDMYKDRLAFASIWFCLGIVVATNSIYWVIPMMIASTLYTLWAPRRFEA